jgi:hypothetical protein
MRKWGGFSGLAISFLIMTSLIVTPAAFGQGGATGALSGVVQDKSGSGVASARVTLLKESTKEVLRTETTDSSGSFTMTLLPAGT